MPTSKTMWVCCLLLAVCAQTSSAQNAPASQLATQAAALPRPTETMVVLGSATSVPLAESASSVLVLPVETKTLSLESPQDLLRQDSSVQLEQRGAGGGQADVVLRGGTFEQTLVLLNGFRINDSQTAHHNLDIPVPFEAMDSIEVLHGAGSTLHGADALSGVVDFLTAAPSASSLRLRAGGGSFGGNEESLLGASDGAAVSPQAATSPPDLWRIATTATKMLHWRVGSAPGLAPPTCCLPSVIAPLAQTSFTGHITRGNGPKTGLPPRARS
jgi:outer membrane cobalamin receptor